jgi:Domain of unknown function (DUF222)/HNH endonuclease
VVPKNLPAHTLSCDDPVEIEHPFDYNRGMSGDDVQAGVTLLHDGLTALHDAAGPHGSETDRVAVLSGLAAVEQHLHRVTVDTVAALQRDGSFAAHGQRAVTAVSELLGIEARDARRIVLVAEQVCPRVDLQGQILPAVLPATAAAFHAGAVSLRQVEVIARLMNSPTAQRLSPDVHADAEAQIAAMAVDTTPAALRTWAVELLELLDQDGAKPDDREPALVNEMFLNPNPDGPGGRITARFDDADLYDAIASVIDAKSAPLTKDDHRSLGQRQAEAMAEVFGYVADHADSDLLPAVAGNRPHLNILIRWEDLQAQARAAMLDFGGQMSAAAARMACCDACIIPIVMNGVGLPLDVGRKQRTIPEGIRRAVYARDRGCAHPGCDRTASWTHIHHVMPWEHGGATALTNVVMLCKTHHREIHSSEWAVRIAPDGQPEFIPPKWIDPQQRARRKPPPPQLPPPPDPPDPPGTR